MITALSIQTDRADYSRYSDDHPIINVSGVATGGGTSDNLTITLSRTCLSGQCVMFDQVIHPDSSGNFSVAIDLRALIDSDGIPTANFSLEYHDYTAAVAAGLLSASAPLSVVPVTVAQMKTRWCNGLALVSLELRALAQQPQQVTGVTLAAPSFLTPIGGAPLVFTPGSPATLTWGLGTPINVTASGTYVLVDMFGNSVLATIVFGSLPSAATTENIAVTYGQMSDEAIIREVISRANEVREALNIFLEPTRLVTRQLLSIDPTVVAGQVYERIGMALNFYKPDNFLKWLEVKFPYTPLRKIYKLSGYFNKSKSLDIDNNLITVDDRSGQMSFVPSNLAIINSFFVGPGLYILFFNQIQIPQFWNYYLLAGYDKCPEPVIDYIATRAAINLLIQAGQALLRLGVTSYSTSRDGVSESQTMLPLPYKAIIDAYNEQLGRAGGTDQRLKSLRNRYRGFAFTTL